MRPRERGEGQDLGLGLVHQRPELLERPAELITDLVQGVADGVGERLAEDRAQCRLYLWDFACLAGRRLGGAKRFLAAATHLALWLWRLSLVQAAMARASL